MDKNLEEAKELLRAFDRTTDKPNSYLIHSVHSNQFLSPSELGLQKKWQTPRLCQGCNNKELEAITFSNQSSPHQILGHCLTFIESIN